jgi:hypothetical protein
MKIMDCVGALVHVCYMAFYVHATAIDNYSKILQLFI